MSFLHGPRSQSPWEPLKVPASWPPPLNTTTLKMPEIWRGSSFLTLDTVTHIPWQHRWGQLMVSSKFAVSSKCLSPYVLVCKDHFRTFPLVSIRFLSRLHCDLRDHTWDRLFSSLEGNQHLARFSFVAAQNVHSDPVTIAKGFPFKTEQSQPIQHVLQPSSDSFLLRRHQLYCK